LDVWQVQWSFAGMLPLCNELLLRLPADLACKRRLLNIFR
jgi:hypothetical protein